MCMFCSDLPSDERGSSYKKAPIALYLKPNDPENESEKYRFRVLNFKSSDKNDRKYPFISRYVHNHWADGDKGFRIVDDVVVCPSSPYIDARHDDTLGFKDTYRELELKEKKATWDTVCPVCKHYAEAWSAFKNSGKTDKVALERIGLLKKQFQGIIPVYVIKDPINPKNNGRFKCIMLSNKDDYDALISVVNTEIAKIKLLKQQGGAAYEWCNGTNAVDLYLRMEKVPVVWNQGKQNERTGVQRKITKMYFGKTAYDLVDLNKKPIITKEAIDRFEFDDQYYVKSTKDELESFYQRHFALGAVADIPDDEDEDGSIPAPVKSAPQEKVTIPTGVSSPEKKVDMAVIDDLMKDPDDLPAETVPSNEEDDLQTGDDEEPVEDKTADSTKSVEELLDALDFKD